MKTTLSTSQAKLFGLNTEELEEKYLHWIIKDSELNGQFVQFAMGLARLLDGGEKGMPLVSQVQYLIAQEFPRVRNHLTVNPADTYIRDPNYLARSFHLKLYIDVLELLFEALVAVVVEDAQKTLSRIWKPLRYVVRESGNIGIYINWQLNREENEILAKEWPDALHDLGKPAGDLAQSFIKLLETLSSVSTTTEIRPMVVGHAVREIRSVKENVDNFKNGLNVLGKRPNVNKKAQRVIAVSNEKLKPLNNEITEMARDFKTDRLERAKEKKVSKEQKALQRRFTNKVRVVGSAGSIAGTALLIAGEKKAAKVVFRSTEYATGVASDIAQAIPPTPWSVAAAGFSVVDRTLGFIVGFDSKSDRELIVEEIRKQTVRVLKAIDKFRKEMHARFDHLERKIDKFRADIFKKIQEVADGVKSLQEASADIKTQLTRIEQILRSGFESLRTKDYLTARLGALKYYQDFDIEGWPVNSGRIENTKSQYQAFTTWALTAPLDNILSYPWRSGYKAEDVVRLVSDYGTAKNARVLSEYAQRNLGVNISVPSNEIPNQIVWADGAVALAEFIRRTPDFPVNKKLRESLEDVLNVGNSYEALAADLSKSPVLFKELFSSLGEHVKKGKKGIEEAYKKVGSGKIHRRVKSGAEFWGVYFDQAIRGEYVRFQFVDSSIYDSGPVIRFHSFHRKPYGAMSEKDCVKALKSMPSRQYLQDLIWTLKGMRAIKNKLDNVEGLTYAIVALYRPLNYMYKQFDAYRGTGLIVPKGGHHAFFQSSDSEFAQLASALLEFQESFVNAKSSKERDGARKKLGRTLQIDRLEVPKVKSKRKLKNAQKNLGFAYVFTLPFLERDYSVVKFQDPEFVAKFLKRINWPEYEKELRTKVDLIRIYVQFLFSKVIEDDARTRLEFLQCLEELLEIEYVFANISSMLSGIRYEDIPLSTFVKPRLQKQVPIFEPLLGEHYSSNLKRLKEIVELLKKNRTEHSVYSSVVSQVYTDLFASYLPTETEK